MPLQALSVSPGLVLGVQDVLPPPECETFTSNRTRP